MVLLPFGVLVPVKSSEDYAIVSVSNDRKHLKRLDHWSPRVRTFPPTLFSPRAYAHDAVLVDALLVDALTTPRERHA